MKKNDLSKLHQKHIKYAFFDIFDTIVSRKVQPEFTKKIWANHLVKRLNISINMTQLYKLRGEIEQKLGEENYNKGNDWEFTYDSLLERLYNELKIKINKEEFKKIATDIEVEVESNVQIPDEEIINEIKKLKKDGKKVYCLSDMYLSKKMIIEIFSNLGIIDLFDEIFVSCEYLKSKRQGNLYKIILEQLNIQPSDCVMTGDNKTADYDNAINNGLEAIHLDRKDKYDYYSEYLEKNNEKNIELKFLELSKINCDQFEHLAFPLYNFTDKLYHYLRKNNYEEVFFLSREGEFLKKLFDLYQQYIYSKKINTHYLIVSRKATYLPSLKKLEEENFESLLLQYRDTSINELLKSLNILNDDKKLILDSFYNDCKKYDGSKLNEKDSKAYKALLDRNYDYKIIKLYKSELLKLLKKNKEFKRIYEAQRKEQHELFHKYIEEKTTNKRICVVDVGWNGSIQNNIQNILGDEYEVNGCLFGFINRTKEKVSYKKGIIFENYPKYSKNYGLYNENLTMFEIILGASHGSADKYILKNGKVEATTFAKEEEKYMYENIVSKIQTKMLDINKELNILLTNGFYNNTIIEKRINKLHFEMVYNPNKTQLEFFNNLYHYDNFGVFEFAEFNLKKKLSFKKYIKENVKFFLKYNSFFYDTFWPTLKLHNEKLFIQKFIYKNCKKILLKKRGVL